MKKHIILIIFLIASFKSFALEVTLTQGTIKPTPIAITDLYSAKNDALKIGKNIVGIYLFASILLGILM